jgi:hypothetical protein
MRNAKPPKKFVTRAEKRTAKVEIESLSNPYSGDLGFEAFQENRKKEHTPVLDAAKKMRIGWNALALGGKDGRAKAEAWNELTNKMEIPKKDDPGVVKAIKYVARATPVPVIAGAIATGMKPIAVYPSIKGSSDFIDTVSRAAKMKRDVKKDVKVLAKSSRPGASEYQKKAGDIVRSKYEARGYKQEEIDRQKYGASLTPTTYALSEKTKKFKKR